MTSGGIDTRIVREMATPTRPGTRFARPRGTNSEQIAKEIRRHIAEQGLRPDDRLGTEHELAQEFGVSRPTLREALRLLASSHLVRVSRGPGGGVFVASTQNEGIGRNLSESIAAMLETDSVSLKELVEARILLEVPLAGLDDGDGEPRLQLAELLGEQRGRDAAADDQHVALVPGHV